MSAGLLFGLITMLVQYVGLFMLGFHTGLLVGLVGLCGVELHYTPPSAWLTLGVLLASGLTLALLNLYFQVISSTWLTMHTGRLTVDLAEVVDYLRVVTVRRGHL